MSGGSAEAVVAACDTPAVRPRRQARGRRPTVGEHAAELAGPAGHGSTDDASRAECDPVHCVHVHPRTPVVASAGDVLTRAQLEA